MASRLWANGLLALVSVALCAIPWPAAAYTCARVQNVYRKPAGPSLRWARDHQDGDGSGRTIHWSLDRAGTRFVAADVVEKTAQQAFATWQNISMTAGLDRDSCPLIAPATVMATDLRFAYDGQVAQSFAGFNYLDPASNHNMVIFHDDSWPYENAGSQSAAIALTVASVNIITGEIFDADIEVNTKNFAFGTGDTITAKETDLLGTLTHEVGHVLGFGHSLEPSAVMYKQAATSEISKRRLTCDDASLLTYRYPPDAPTNDCGPTDSIETCGDCRAGSVLKTRPAIARKSADSGMRGNGCHAAGAAAPAGWAAFAAAVRRRRRQRP